MYISEKKPVIPLDLPLQNHGASEKLFVKAMENPNTFFKCDRPEDAARAFSRLSLKSKLLQIDDFETRFFNFISLLRKPRAFYVRLLNKEVPEFDQVENFFRNVVDEVVETSGYEKFESGTDVSKEAFINVEIFSQLHYSSLVIVDLTGVRPNCCLELGYALGQSKKGILTAKKGTKLPFDAKMIHCHFWLPNEADHKRKKRLKKFMEKNINRYPIVVRQ